MDIPSTDIEVKPNEFVEARAADPQICCNLFDTEIVHKVAQLFVPGLASACVDNTTGDLFKTPASVAVDMRKEMVDYLLQRSEAFVAESVILEGGPDGEISYHPCDIISNFIEDFSSLKRNIFSRVSGWLLSESREDKIDDFIQEMEINGFWLLDRRETIVQTLLKNVDFKNMFYCNMKFNSQDELKEHELQCSFRALSCKNEGCNSSFSASHLEAHDSVCPFKILPCEQKCSNSIMRREMDKHCITVCPMKLVNCPFYQVGCQLTFPVCKIEEHRVGNVHSHLLCILRVIHKDACEEDLKNRVDQIERSMPPGRLAEVRDVRMLTYAIKDLESDLGPLKRNIKLSEDHIDSPIRKESAEVKQGSREDKAT